MSVYDQARAHAQAQSDSISPWTTAQNKLSDYLQLEVPSFEEFRAALRAQLQMIAQLRLAAAQATEAREHADDEGEDDSDNDSYEGEYWSDEDVAAQSYDSLTDADSEGQQSECSSPTFESAEAKYDRQTERRGRPLGYPAPGIISEHSQVQQSVPDRAAFRLGHNAILQLRIPCLA